MSLHTDGPWDYTIDEKAETFMILARSGPIIVESLANEVSPYSRNQKAEREANAALLAGAPALLRACRRAAEHVEDEELLAELNSAISAAEVQP